MAHKEKMIYFVFLENDTKPKKFQTKPELKKWVEQNMKRSFLS